MLLERDRAPCRVGAGVGGRTRLLDSKSLHATPRHSRSLWSSNLMKRLDLRLYSVAA